MATCPQWTLNPSPSVTVVERFDCMIPRKFRKLESSFFLSFPSLLVWENLRFESWDLYLESPETFCARKAIFSSSVSNNAEMYVPETFCMKQNLCSFLEYVNKTAL